VLTFLHSFFKEKKREHKPLNKWFVIRFALFYSFHSLNMPLLNSLFRCFTYFRLELATLIFICVFPSQKSKIQMIIFIITIRKSYYFLIYWEFIKMLQKLHKFFLLIESCCCFFYLHCFAVAVSINKNKEFLLDLIRIKNKFLSVWKVTRMLTFCSLFIFLINFFLFSCDQAN